MKNLALIGFLAMFSVIFSLLACTPPQSGDDDAAADDDATPAGDDDDNDDSSPGADDDDDDNDDSANVNVPANDANWTPTGLQGAVGDRLTVNATGLVNLGSDGANVPPGGLPKICGAGCPNPAGHLGALTAKIGVSKSDCIFEVGAHFDGAAACAGALYLIVNDYNYAGNSGSFNAAVVMCPHGDDDNDNDNDDNDNDDSSPPADDDDNDDVSPAGPYSFSLDNNQCVQIPWAAQWAMVSNGDYPVSLTTNYNFHGGDPSGAVSQVLIFMDSCGSPALWYQPVVDGDTVHVANNCEGESPVWAAFPSAACNSATGSAQLSFGGQTISLDNSQCLTIPWAPQVPSIPNGDYKVSLTSDFDFHLQYPPDLSAQVFLFVDSCGSPALWYQAVVDGDIVHVNHACEGTAAIWAAFPDNVCSDNTGSAQVTLTRQQPPDDDNDNDDDDNDNDDNDDNDDNNDDDSSSDDDDDDDNDTAPDDDDSSTVLLDNAIDQGANHDFVISTKFASDPNGYTAYAAEDFAVPTGHSWMIEELAILGDGWDGFTTLATATAIDCWIYWDASGVPNGIPNGAGAPIWHESAAPNAANVTLIMTPDYTFGAGPWLSSFTFTPTSAPTLIEGTYWLTCAPTFASNSSGFWGPYSSTASEPHHAQWINPGGGFYGHETSWTDVSAAGFVDPSLAFVLYGADVTDDDDNDDSSPVADDDDGVWTMMRDESDQVTLVSVWGSSPSDVFAVGPGPYDITAALVHYDGNTWSQMSLWCCAFQLSGVWGSSSSDVFAVGNGYDITPNGGYSTGPAVLHYDGASWSQGSMPISGPLPGLSGVWGASPSDVFAVGGNYDASGAPIYHYDGVSWSRMPNDFQTSLSAVWGTSHTDVIAAGGLILHYDGATWSEMTNPNNYIASAVWGSSPSDVYGIHGAKYSTVIIHYDGASWSEAYTADDWYMGVWGSSASDVFVVGSNLGKVLHYDGASWSQMLPDLGLNNWLFGVWGSSATDVFAVGGGGIIEHYAGPTK